MIKLKVSGVSETLKQFDALNKEVTDGSEEALSRTAFKLITEIKRNIIRGGNPTVPLKQSTIDRKGSSKPLIDTGRMLSSVNLIQDLPDKKVVEVGVDYAIHHEYGAPSANIPKRPFVRPGIETVKGLMKSEGVKIEEGTPIT